MCRRKNARAVDVDLVDVVDLVDAVDPMDLADLSTKSTKSTTSTKSTVHKACLLTRRTIPPSPMSRDTVSGDPQQELRESLARYRHIIENANEIIYRADHRGYFTYVNPAATRITGYDEDELIGHHYLELIDPDYRDAAAHFYRHQFTTHAASTYFEFPMIAKSGVRIWMGQNVLTVLDADRIVGYEAIARDITERKGIEDELARTRDAALQSARAKSELDRKSVV